MGVADNEHAANRLNAANRLYAYEVEEIADNEHAANTGNGIHPTDSGSHPIYGQWKAELSRRYHRTSTNL